MTRCHAFGCLPTRVIYATTLRDRQTTARARENTTNVHSLSTYKRLNIHPTFSVFPVCSQDRDVARRSELREIVGVDSLQAIVHVIFYTDIFVGDGRRRQSGQVSRRTNVTCAHLQQNRCWQERRAGPLGSISWQITHLSSLVASTCCRRSDISNKNASRRLCSGFGTGGNMCPPRYTVPKEQKLTIAVTEVMTTRYVGRTQRRLNALCIVDATRMPNQSIVLSTTVAGRCLNSLGAIMSRDGYRAKLGNFHVLYADNEILLQMCGCPEDEETEVSSVNLLLVGSDASTDSTFIREPVSRKDALHARGQQKVTRRDMSVNALLMTLRTTT